MSLFVDVVDVLSDEIKTHFTAIIETEKDGMERTVRKVCDVCSKYLAYGELRYDKVENGISTLGKIPTAGNAFYLLLLSILNEALDEDQRAAELLTEFSKTSLAEPFRKELEDFIAIGRFLTLKEFQALENAGLIIIERYTNENNIAERLTNLYFKAEAEEYHAVFSRLLGRAREIYPDNIRLESFNGFINTVGKNYEQALESFLTVKNNLEKGIDNKFYNYNLASVWDSIADCYLKMGNAEKARESCDIALSFDEKAYDTVVGNPILYKKAEALLQLGEKEQALAIANQILEENEADEIAMTIRETIMKS